MADRILHLARPRKAASASNRYRIQVLDRAAQIMDCFRFDHKELSVSEIGRRTRLHKSTTHRILMALEYNQLIKQNPETGKYHLGIKLFTLGNQAVRQFDLRDTCRPHLIRLMDKTKETVHLAVLDGDQRCGAIRAPRNPETPRRWPDGAGSGRRNFQGIGLRKTKACQRPLGMEH